MPRIGASESDLITTDCSQTRIEKWGMIIQSCEMVDGRSGSRGTVSPMNSPNLGKRWHCIPEQAYQRSRSHSHVKHQRSQIEKSKVKKAIDRQVARMSM